MATANRDTGLSLCRRGVLLGIVGTAALVLGRRARAHNNPGFKEVHLVTIDVRAEADEQGVHGGPFAIDLPKKSIELIWKIEGDEQEDGDAGISFAVAQQGEIMAEAVEIGGTSTVLEGDGFTIRNLEGAETGFALQVFANVIDRSQTTES